MTQTGGACAGRGAAGTSGPCSEPTPSVHATNRPSAGLVSISPGSGVWRTTGGSTVPAAATCCTELGTWSAQAWAGVSVAAALLGWGLVGVLERFPHWWEVALYSVTSAVTVVMLFAIQHSQHREQVVIQRKLDEMLRAEPDADDRMIAAETADDSELRDLIQMGPDDPRTDALGAALDRDDLSGR